MSELGFYSKCCGGGGGGGGYSIEGAGFIRFLIPHNRSTCDISCHKTLQRVLFKKILEMFCGHDVATIVVDDLITKFRIRYTCNDVISIKWVSILFSHKVISMYRFLVHFY